jgi:hypothetical protein
VIGREVHVSANGIADRLGQRGMRFVGDNANELLAMFASLSTRQPRRSATQHSASET